MPLFHWPPWAVPGQLTLEDEAKRLCTATLHGRTIVKTVDDGPANGLMVLDQNNRPGGADEPVPDTLR